MEAPKTLLEAIQYFSDAENCRKFMIAVRWADGVVRCPHCDSEKVTYLAKAKVYQCYGKHAKSKFSLKVGTVFEDSPIGLEKWLPASWLISNCKNGISSYELSRDLGVTQKTAWFMLHRIRKAMEPGLDVPKMGGAGKIVQTDETVIGGDPKNFHESRRERMAKETRPNRTQIYNNTYGHKIAVQGIFDKEARQVRAKVVPNVRRATLQKEILSGIEWGSTLHTDQAQAYKSLKDQFVHETVNHAVCYVSKGVTTNNLENFWSLLKRNLAGTYVAVEPYHLDRYLAEQCFRFNTCKSHNDGSRFTKLISQLAGKRLTYAELTGKEEQAAF
jgi:transposase-like protein